ncbi:MAG: primase-like DNA-binding domain-containing protein [bacterium]
MKELDLIFAWAIKGLPELLQRNEFNIPIELKDQTKEAFKEQDSFLIFFEEYLEKNHDSKIYNKVRYPLYKKFCRDTGEVTLSQIILSKRLIGLGFKSF